MTPATLQPSTFVSPTPQTQSLPGSPLRAGMSLAGKSTGARTLGARSVVSPSQPNASRTGSQSSTTSYPFPQPPARSNSTSSPPPTMSSPTFFSPQPARPAVSSSLSSQSMMAAPLAPQQRQQPKTFFPPLQPQTTSNGFSSTSTSTTQYAAPSKSSRPNYNISLEPSTPSYSIPPSTLPFNSGGMSSAYTSTPMIPNQPLQPSQPQQPPAFFSSTPLQPQRNNNLPQNTGKSSLDFSGFDPLL